MARVTAEEVRTIKDSSAENSEYDSFIDTATTIVDGFSAVNPSFNAPTLKQVELYYTAHLLEQAYPSVSKQTFGDSTGFDLVNQSHEKYLNVLNGFTGGKFKKFLNSDSSTPVFAIA